MHERHSKPVTFTTLPAPLQGVEEPSLCTAATAMSFAVGGNITALPQRPEGPGLGNFSNVLSQPLRCWPNSPLQLHDLKARLRALSGRLPSCIRCMTAQSCCGNWCCSCM